MRKAKSKKACYLHNFECICQEFFRHRIFTKSSETLAVCNPLREIVWCEHSTSTESIPHQILNPIKSQHCIKVRFDLLNVSDKTADLIDQLISLCMHKRTHAKKRQSMCNFENK